MRGSLDQSTHNLRCRKYLTIIALEICRTVTSWEREIPRSGVKFARFESLNFSRVARRTNIGSPAAVSRFTLFHSKWSRECSDRRECRARDRRVNYSSREKLTRSFRSLTRSERVNNPTAESNGGRTWMAM